MKNRPGISWGVDSPINLTRSSIGWIAVYYDNDTAPGEILRVFKPKNIVEYVAMQRKVGWYNYHTNRLCPLVEAEMSWIS